MTSPSNSPNCSPTSTTACPTTTPSSAWPRPCPGSLSDPSPGCWAPRSRAAIWAAQLGLPYAFADFINPHGSDIAAVLPDRLHADAGAAAGRTAVAVWALCAPTDEEAEYLVSSSRMSMRMLRRGQLIAVPSPERAVEFLAREPRRPQDGSRSRRVIIGTPEKVRAGIEQVATEYGAEEVIVVTITYDHAVRRRSYELIADAFGLAPREDLSAAAA